MASKQNKEIILLSVKPIYASFILNGYKTVEFRKTGFVNGVAHAVLYVSSPVKMVMGYFSIANVFRNSPNSLWNSFGEFGCISYELFRKYYGDSESGVAIEIADAYQLKTPIVLDELRSGLFPPQSFSYLECSVFNKLLSAPARKVAKVEKECSLT